MIIKRRKNLIGRVIAFDSLFRFGKQRVRENMQIYPQLLAQLSNPIITPSTERSVIAVDEYGLYVLMFKHTANYLLRQSMIEPQLTACCL
jgi:hypothetical protein